ncbi:hypothetical protein LTR94_027650, partial [Friedmanniomyces endolithicus]
VDPKLIKGLIASETEDWVPVIAPIGVAEDGQTFNVNADTVAGAVAGSLGAKRMLLLTDVPGVKGADGEIIRQMTLDEAQRLIDTGVASGGMIPKLETAMAAVQAGVEAVVILDGRRPHAMLVELFTEFGAEAVGMAPEDAAVLQRQFLDEHGTTLAGLMANYAVDTERFLHEVHDVPLDGVEPNPRLAEKLRSLPGERFVFTNGAREYAHRVLDRIGVSDCFSGVFAIEDGDLTPKPNPATFRRMLERFSIDPLQAAFFEDTPKNLEPARDLGMTTVLVGTKAFTAEGDHIQHRAASLGPFLTTAMLDGDPQ